MKHMGRMFNQYSTYDDLDWRGAGVQRSLQLDQTYLVAAVFDIVAIVSGILVAIIGYDDLLGGSPLEWRIYIAVWLLCGPLLLLGNWAIGLYATSVLVHPVKHLVRTLTICALLFLALFSALSILNFEAKIATGNLLIFAASMSLLCGLTRVLANGIISEQKRRKTLVGRPVYLIGDADELEVLTPTDLMAHFGLRETGRMVVTPSETQDPSRFRGLIQDAVNQARHGRSRELLVVTRLNSLDYLANIESGLRRSPLPVRLIPPKDLRTIIAREAAPWDVGRYIVDLQRAPMKTRELVAKRVLDIVCAAAGILVILPLLLVIAAAIRIDSPGPAIFRQRRNGFDQKQFVIFKFRTMRVLEDGGSVTQATRNDNRITRIGRWLRRSSLDELPQLFNVLRGEMSLVGPRPHALAHDQFYTSTIDDYCIRHHVKPGITGWAQINGCRGETSQAEDMERRVTLDLWYIKNWSLRLDLKILMRTCFDVLGHDAY